jgi:murein L,D-transpeptidase YcbB/YkuD
LRDQALALEQRNFVPTHPIGDLPDLLKVGSQGEKVHRLAQALLDRGFLVGDAAALPQVYDTTLKEAVSNAQQAFGLTVDGIAGPLLYLNLDQSDVGLALALREWADQVDSYLSDARAEAAPTLVVVNLPSFTLHVFDTATGDEVLQSRVVVGSLGKTPRYMTHITNLKYNPDWSPPPSLVAKGKHYVPPGPNNPLGQMRFSTDRGDSIYLHDTNEHSLFALSNRARSHGCIRVQQWMGLAERLSGKDEATLRQTLATGKTSYEKVARTPVVLAYSRVDRVEEGAGVVADIYAVGDAAIGSAALRTPVIPVPAVPVEKAVTAPTVSL